MRIINEIKQMEDLTESEKEIAKFLLENPEKIGDMTSKDLGEVTFTSPATVSRFCQKLGCSGYSAFRIRFLSELNQDMQEEKEQIQVVERENIVVVTNKVMSAYKKAISETKTNFSWEQMLGVHKFIHEAEYIDFYAYDMNVHLAQYGCSQFFHLGKVANTYVATNIQELNAMLTKEKHFAIILSHTGENARLVEIAKTLKKQKTKTLLISRGNSSTLSEICDETIVACIDGKKIYNLWSVMYSTSVKYILDILFTMEYSAKYKEVSKFNDDYEKVGEEILWGLLKKELD